MFELSDTHVYKSVACGMRGIAFAGDASGTRQLPRHV